MPNRFIKESCRSSKNLDKISDFEERLFWRLITTADDFGRFLACPALVRSACFPYRTISVATVTKALLSLQSHRLISLYTIDDRQYGNFVTWEKHQGKPRSSKSKYPAKLDTFLQADASSCEQMRANVPEGPNTNTDTDSKTNPIPSLSFLNSPNPKKGKRSISEDDKPTQKHFDLGKLLGIDVGPEWGKFKNYCKAHDKRYADFEAAFRNWIARSGEMKGGSYVRSM